MYFRKVAIITIITILCDPDTTLLAQTQAKDISRTNKNNLSFSSRDSVLPRDQHVLIGRLPNGLTYYIRKNSAPKNRAELYLVNKVGSILETDDQRGLAHFIEHMAFHGTRDFSENELVNFLRTSGVKFGADVNAYTSFDETVYHLPVPTDSIKQFEKGFEILSNWAGMQTFDAGTIDAERDVIVEEARQRGKDAQERMQSQILPVLLNNSQYADRLPIGKEDIIKSFTPNTVESFFHDWYRPDLQAVIVIGDFDVQQVVQLIKAKFSRLTNPKHEQPRTKFSIPFARGTVIRTITDSEFPYTLAEIVIKHPKTIIRTKQNYLSLLRKVLFNEMINARLGELSKKSDPPFLFAQTRYSGFIGDQDALMTTVIAKSAKQLKQAIQATNDEIERARKFGFTNSELDRAKNNALTHIENAFKERDKNPSINFAREYQQNFLFGDAMPGINFEYHFQKNNIRSITLAEINLLTHNFLSDQNRVVLVEAPEKEKAMLPNNQQLAN